MNYSFSGYELEHGVALRELASTAFNNLRTKVHHAHHCEKGKVQTRREWRHLPLHERIEFTDAVECLQALPTELSPKMQKAYPAVKSRYDEFVAVHIELSNNIHMSAEFFAWHRYFIHLFEQDLRDKCNYPGRLPYWEWGYDAFAPQNSSLFNGQPGSMGSNGEWIPNRGSQYWVSNHVDIPTGTGGGCVFAGPFVNYTVKMGPIDAPGVEPVADKFAYNPRCLSRDLNPTVMSTSVTFRNTTEHILEYDDVAWFQGVMQHDPRYPAEGLTYSLHGGGHIGVGLILGDVEASPSDPMFWLHHAQIDRVWAIWQGLSPHKRVYQISGTHTHTNEPPTANMTLDEMLDFGFIAEPVKFADLMHIRSGPFCYEYA
ncbi:tyrosinase [Aspergillus steynii IBT 23096]|uniref:Tyrosinase n=1 Tax=Aspergillus steynii IBT 23096 TaxID=1392250 RepID=A0A2I2G6K0_9EURO|nr:tyrosinase [Aspergillus steynii IBT 23096]PLB48499.1 tyrosinase [Aspergillus steynii IBT 23096]